MKPAPAAALLRRLAPLTLVVLAVHLLLLQPEPREVTPPSPVPFHTRTIAPPPAPPPAPSAAPPAPPVVAQPTPPPAPSVHPAPPAPAQRRAVAQAPVAEPPPPMPLPPPAPATTTAPLPAAPAESPPRRASTPRATTAAAVTLPPPVRLHYEVQAQVKGFTLGGGRAELTWRHDGQSYEARMEASALGRPRVQRSVGRVTPQGLAPDYFSDKSRSEQATHFDREKNRIVFSNNKPEAALAEGAQDRLSVVLQLASLVAGNPQHYRPGTTLTVPTAGTSDSENWVFSVEGEEDLRLPGGAVHALKLQRLPRKEYDQKVELWLAPALDYAPVRLRLTNPNGDAVDQRWSSTDRG